MENILYQNDLYLINLVSVASDDQLFFIRKHSPYMFINEKKILIILIFLRTYWLTFFRLMEFSIKLHTMKSGWPIVYFLL